MVDDKPADTCRTRAVEVDGCDGGGIVRQEEIAVDSREHGNESQWRDAQAYAQRVKRAHPTNPVEGCADANPKTMLPNDT